MAPPATSNNVTRFEGKDYKWFEANLHGSDKAQLLEKIATFQKVDPHGNPNKIDPGIETIAVANLLYKNPTAINKSPLSAEIDSYTAKIRPTRIRNVLLRIKQIGDTLKAIKANPAAQNAYNEIVSILKKQAEQNDAPYIRGDQIKDDHFKGDYISWFLADLTQSAIVLYQLGDSEMADRYLGLAELVSSILLKTSPTAITVANVSAKYVLANWKNNKDPLGDLGNEIDQYIIRNAAHIDKSIHDFSKNNLEDVRKARPDLYDLLQKANVINQVEIAKADKEFTFPSLNVVPLASGRYNASVEDYIAAISFNFSLSTSDPQIQTFLDGNLNSLPCGTAYTLGGGDGRETRQVALYPQKFDTVYNLDQSALSVDRTMNMARRMQGILALTSIDGVKVDIVDYKYPTQSANLITANHVIEFIPPNRRRILFDKLGTALKEGGKVYISVHLINQGAMFNRFKALSADQFREVPVAEAQESGTLEFIDTTENGKKVVKRKHFFKAGDLKKELEAQGFTEDRGFRVEIIGIGESGGFVEERTVITRIKPIPKAQEQPQAPQAPEKKGWKYWPWNW